MCIDLIIYIILIAVHGPEIVTSTRLPIYRVSDYVMLFGWDFLMFHEAIGLRYRRTAI